MLDGEDESVERKRRDDMKVRRQGSRKKTSITFHLRKEAIFLKNEGIPSARFHFN